MALCSLWKTDLINAKFIFNTIHINMGQHLLKMLHLVDPVSHPKYLTVKLYQIIFMLKVEVNKKAQSFIC